MWVMGVLGRCLKLGFTIGDRLTALLARRGRLRQATVHIRGLLRGGR